MPVISTALAAAGPLTLAAMLGMPAEPARLADATLIVVDAQGEYRDGAMRLEGIDDAVEHLSDLLTRARGAGTPVIHIVQRGAPGGLFDPDGPRGAILARLEPKPGEPVIAKPLPDAFVGTDLAERLLATGRKKVIVVGFQTHLCVDATVRDAAARGYGVTVAADATATRTLPDPTGGTPVPAAVVERAALAGMNDVHAVVVNTAAIK